MGIRESKGGGSTEAFLSSNMEPGRPKVHRKVGHRVVTQVLGGEDLEEFDPVRGLTRADLGGGRTGFGQHVRQAGVRLESEFLPGRYLEGSAGAGPDVGEKPERHRGGYDDYEVSGVGGGEEPLFQDEGDLIGDDSSMDLFGEPQGDRNHRPLHRTEYADEIHERREAPATSAWWSTHQDDMTVMPLSTGRPGKPALARREPAPAPPSRISDPVVRQHYADRARRPAPEEDLASLFRRRR